VDGDNAATVGALFVERKFDTAFDAKRIQFAFHA
jgi:hypothetical protein